MLFFFHCHKAAGSTVVDAAQRSGIRLPQTHRNGNLLDAEGKVLRWSALSTEEALERIATERAQGTEMLCFEFDYPDWTALRSIPGTQWFTVLRDPMARAFSNYRMDVLAGFVKQGQVLGFDSYMNGASLFRADNYYVRFFSGRFGPGRDPVSRDHLALALRRLEELDAVAILEQGTLAETLSPLGFKAESFGWRNRHEVRRQKDDAPAWTADLDIDSFPVEPEFYQRHAFDYALYARAAHYATKRPAVPVRLSA